MEKIKVGVIAGGKSGEHEVSLVSATSVIKNFNKEKYDVFPIGITKQGKWISGPNIIDNLKSSYIEQNYYSSLISHPKLGKGIMNIKLDDDNSINFQPLDVLFPVLHGTYGEDGTIQGLFEMYDIPYVGCNVLSSAVGMDKDIFKQLAKQNNLPSLNFYSFIKNDWQENRVEVLRRIVEMFDLPVFVKPANLGSSVGISKVKQENELEKAIENSLNFDNKVIVEQGLENIKEIECSVLGIGNDVQASICGQIKPSNEFYDFNAKYIDDQSEIIIPANISKETEEEIRKLAIKAFKMINGNGLARVDFFITEDNKIYLDELNTMPGFTSVSMYAELWKKTGLSYPELLDKLIDLAFQAHKIRSSKLTDFSSQSDWYKQDT